MIPLCQFGLLWSSMSLCILIWTGKCCWRLLWSLLREDFKKLLLLVGCYVLWLALWVFEGSFFFLYFNKTNGSIIEPFFILILYKDLITYFYFQISKIISSFYYIFFILNKKMQKDKIICILTICLLFSITLCVPIVKRF